MPIFTKTQTARRGGIAALLLLFQYTLLITLGCSGPAPQKEPPPVEVAAMREEPKDTIPNQPKPSKKPAPKPVVSRTIVMHTQDSLTQINIKGSRKVDSTYLSLVEVIDLTSEYDKYAYDSPSPHSYENFLMASNYNPYNDTLRYASRADFFAHMTNTILLEWDFHDRREVRRRSRKVDYINLLTVQQYPRFGEGTKTVRLVQMTHNGVVTNQFFALKHGQLTKRFDVECYYEANFTKLNEQQSMAKITERDEVVYSFQSDYMVLHDRTLDTLRFITPEVQDLDAKTKTLDTLICYSSIPAAQARDTNQMAILLPGDTPVSLDSLYREFNVLKVFTTDSTSCYFHVQDLTDEKIQKNMAG
ncbi:MAG: hypothetical protein AAF828_09865 [Bacteroidota bacterium]